MSGMPATGKVGIERLAIHFGKSLGGAKHGHRLDRLVGGDHHHRGDAAAAAASATLTEPNTLVLTPSSQFCSSSGTCLSAAA